MEEILEALQREESDWAQLQIKVHNGNVLRNTHP